MVLDRPAGCGGAARPCCAASRTRATARSGTRNRAAMNRWRWPASCWRTARSSSSAARSPTSMRAMPSPRGGAGSLNALHGGRFVLGLGVTHIPMVEGLRGHQLRQADPRHARLSGRHRARVARHGGPVLLAALGPKMLALARGHRRRGALQRDAGTYEAGGGRSSARARCWRWSRRSASSRQGPRPRAGPQGTGALHDATELLNNWLRVGFTEAELADGGNDRFIDAMVLSGDAETVKAGLRAHFAAGATHVCIQPVTEDGDIAPATPCWRRWPIPEGTVHADARLQGLGGTIRAGEAARFRRDGGAGGVRFPLHLRPFPARKHTDGHAPNSLVWPARSVHGRSGW